MHGSYRPLLLNCSQVPTPGADSLTTQDGSSFVYQTHSPYEIA